MIYILKIKEWKKLYKDFIFPMKVVRTLLSYEEPKQSMLNYCKNTMGNVAASLNKLNKEMESILLSNTGLVDKLLDDNSSEPPENIMPKKIDYAGPSGERPDLIVEFNWLVGRCGWDIHHYLMCFED